MDEKINKNIEEYKEKFNALIEENKHLKNLVKGDENDKKFSRRNLAYYAWRSFITGKTLDKTLQQAVEEYNKGKIEQKTAVSVIASAFNRIYRVSIPFLILALLPSIFVLVQTMLLRNQNKLIIEQNTMIAKQNERIDQQIQLNEAERRSSMMLTMSSIMDDLPQTGGGLSASTIGKIVALSRGFSPYRYLDGDTLITKPISPERGQLLINLTESSLDQAAYRKIFSRGNFSFADLKRVDFYDAFMSGINLRNANLGDASFYRCNLQTANFSDADLNRTIFVEAKLNRVDFVRANLQGANLKNADISGADFEGANMQGVDLSGTKVDTQDWFSILKKMKMSPIGIEALEKKYKIVREEGIYRFKKK